MLMTKLKITITVVLALNLIGAGVGLVYCQTAGTGQTGKEKPILAQEQQRPPKADGKDEEKKDGGAEPKAAAAAPPAKTDAPKLVSRDAESSERSVPPRLLPKRTHPNPCQRTSSRPGRRPEPQSAGCV